MNEVVTSVFSSIFRFLRIAGGIALLLLTAIFTYIAIVMFLEGALWNAFSVLFSALFTFACSLYLLLGSR
jgi:hypothetical protein